MQGELELFGGRARAREEDDRESGQHLRQSQTRGGHRPNSPGDDTDLTEQVSLGGNGENKHTAARFQHTYTYKTSVGEGGSAELTRDKNITGMYCRRGSSPPPPM